MYTVFAGHLLPAAFFAGLSYLVISFLPASPFWKAIAGGVLLLGYYGYLFYYGNNKIMTSFNRKSSRSKSSTLMVYSPKL
jgi:hypothetical protein